MPRLSSHIVSKPWGVLDPPAPFAPTSDGPLGEVWFSPPPHMQDMLVKYIFTSEALSVQVHPSDEQTLSLGLGRCGKEECWFIIDAKPDAKLAVGFSGRPEPEEIREAALHGYIEELLAWHPVRPGSFFYIPAGTIHTIGAGIALIEVQQYSDITYRLYDYGRPRTLHLDQGLQVLHRAPYDTACMKQVPSHTTVSLVDGPFFKMDRLYGPPSEALCARYPGPVLILPLSHSIDVEGHVVAVGECASADDMTEVDFPEDGLCLITQPALCP